MANNVFTDLLTTSIQSGVAPALAKQSQQWLQTRATKINESADRYTNKLEIGKMYLFSYMPKTRDVLPYYDQLPLIFPFATTSNGFYGINMHYLPYMYRARLMDALHSLASNKNYDESTRLKLSYQVLSKSSKFRYFSPCVKLYLNSHVNSRFISIYSNEWNTALFLPLERFAKKTKQQVFQDSIKKIKG